MTTMLSPATTMLYVQYSAVYSMVGLAHEIELLIFVSCTVLGRKFKAELCRMTQNTCIFGFRTSSLL